MNSTRASIPSDSSTSPAIPSAAGRELPVEPEPGCALAPRAEPEGRDPDAVDPPADELPPTVDPLPPAVDAPPAVVLLEWPPPQEDAEKEEAEEGEVEDK